MCRPPDHSRAPRPLQSNAPHRPGVHAPRLQPKCGPVQFHRPRRHKPRCKAWCRISPCRNMRSARRSGGLLSTHSSSSVGGPWASTRPSSCCCQGARAARQADGGSLTGRCCLARNATDLVNDVEGGRRITCGTTSGISHEAALGGVPPALRGIPPPAAEGVPHSARIPALLCASRARRNGAEAAADGPRRGRRASFHSGLVVDFLVKARLS